MRARPDLALEDRPSRQLWTEHPVRTLYGDQLKYLWAAIWIVSPGTAPALVQLVDSGEVRLVTLEDKGYRNAHEESVAMWQQGTPVPEANVDAMIAALQLGWRP